MRARETFITPLNFYNPERIIMQVEIFNNEELGKVRVAMQEGEPFFCAYDVCRILDIKNPYSTLASMFKEGLHTMEVLTNGGKQRASFLNEAQLYEVIFKSRRPEAKQFKKWVFEEVLPSIRKTGGYSITQSPKIPQDIEEVLEMALELARERKRLLAQVAEDAPKVECYNALMDSKDCLDFGHFAKNIGLGRNTLLKKLRENGVLMWDNIPYAEFMNRGYFRVVEGTYSNGGYSKIYQKTLITPKGQVYLQKRLNEVGA